MKVGKVKLNGRKIKYLGIIFLLIFITLSVYLLKNSNTTTLSVSGATAKILTYDVVEEDDDAVDKTDYVKFDAFFLQSSDDEYAEGVRGTCNEIGTSSTLYMELKVLARKLRRCCNYN